MKAASRGARPCARTGRRAAAGGGTEFMNGGGGTEFMNGAVGVRGAHAHR